MSESYYQEMRDRLNSLRRDLESVSDVGDEASQVVELDQAKVGRLSRMDAMQAQAMSQAAVRRRETTLKAIEMALQRIESGDFGSCQSCDEPIAVKRLEFDPTASLCIDCARKSELNEQR